MNSYKRKKRFLSLLDDQSVLIVFILILIIGLELIIYNFNSVSPHDIAVEKKEYSQEYLEELKSQTLPYFHASKLDGEDFSQINLMEKDVNIFYFWAVSSEISQHQLDDLALYSKTLPDNIRVISACVDGGKNLARVKKLMKGAGFKGITLIDGSADYFRLVDNIDYLPTILFFDSEGNQIADPVIGIVDDMESVFDYEKYLND